MFLALAQEAGKSARRDDDILALVHSPPSYGRIECWRIGIVEQNRAGRELQRIDHVRTIDRRDDQPCFAHRTRQSAIAGDDIDCAIEIELVPDFLAERVQII